VVTLLSKAFVHTHDPARDAAAGDRARGRRATRPAGHHAGSPTVKPLGHPWAGSAWQRHAGGAGHLATVPAAAPGRPQPAQAVSHGALTTTAHPPAGRPHRPGRSMCEHAGYRIAASPFSNRESGGGGPRDRCQALALGSRAGKRPNRATAANRPLTCTNRPPTNLVDPTSQHANRVLVVEGLTLRL
jgi:hypothetical protein